MDYSIAGKQLKLNNAEDVDFIVKEINGNPLKSLDLSGNTIGIESSKKISEILQSSVDTLQTINLSDIFTGRLNTEVPQCLSYLLPTLLKCKHLTTINLSDNALGLQTIEPIEQYLSKAVTIENLILSNNGMGPFAGERIGKSLYKLAQLKASNGHPSLKTFICGRNRLENGSMKYLTLGLIHHKDLQELRLYQNGIRPIGISILINGLKANKNLKILDLQDNTLTYLGSTSISKNLNDWKLTELNLNDCLLKSKGFGEILEVLEHQDGLKTLKLQYNELNKEVLTKLFDVVQKLTLESLEINGNKLEDDDELIEQYQDLLGDKVDEMDEMEGEDSDDEEDDEGEEDEEIIDFEELAKELDGTDEDQDAGVDSIADKLDETHI
ncbi:ran GTPase-activating protein 1 [[Candida] jaroonii]|uniref:Ran GTPase-activating protein 1 n=1 Tax=[Candida] jaroonii TaxID=467808 RepID=A0ACA9YDD4_9ASCO|nr:ran GTPase-activating protein 1 [[Candida] jaroonii]